MQKEVGRMRLLRVMLAILEQPGRYTKKELAEKMGSNDDNIRYDLEALGQAGLSLEYDRNYRYKFKEQKPIDKLNDLLYFTEEDQELLKDTIDHLFQHDKRAAKLKRKLDSLYDYHQLGLEALRKPNLKKIELLKQAQANKKVVIIHDYHSSNSNSVSNRIVEPFHVATDIDLLHAFDLDRMELRHFRISRMVRITIQETDWKHSKKHHIKLTDPFGILDDTQKMIHLRLKVGAYNELIERFPAAERYVRESADEEGIYDFQCKVNHQFIGLTNYILGYYHQIIEIIGPDELIEHLEKEVGKIQERLINS